MEARESNARARPREISQVAAVHAPQATMSKDVTLDPRIWGEHIRRAMDQEALTLVAQPIVDLRGGPLDRYELLLRMSDGHGALVPAGAFVGTAERTGLVQEIDCWVVARAIGLLAERGPGGGEPTIHVNVSPLSIGDPALLEVLGRELRLTQVPPERLVLELTETTTVTDVAGASQFVGALSRLGCGLALDDFGAGYASFSRLKQFPFDFIKIDGEFVRGCASNETDRVLIRAAVEIAAGMGKQTIAEYVEDEATAQVLARLGVDYGQGFHLGRPAPLS